MTVSSGVSFCLKAELISTEKNDVVRAGVTTLHASNQMLRNVWSYDFYDYVTSINEMDVV